MKFSYCIPILSFLSLFLISCERESLVRVDVPDSDPKPFVICFASPGQAVLAYIGKTISFNTNSKDTFLRTSVIKIMEEEHLLGELTALQSASLYQSKQVLPFRSGLPYRFEMNTADYGIIESQAEYLPEKTNIDTCFIKDSMPAIFDEVIVTLRYQDKKGVQNYYTYKHILYENEKILIDSIPGFNAYLPTFAINDQKIEGLLTSTNLAVPKALYRNKRRIKATAVDIVLYSLSKETYTFLSSIRQNEGSNADLFIEPVPTTTNIKNGYGIFGLFQSDTFRIIF